MKRKGLCWFRLLLGLALFAAFGAPPGGLGVVVQHIQIVGARQWLNLVAGSFAGSLVSSTPLVAPVSERIARALPAFVPIAGDARSETA